MINGQTRVSKILEGAIKNKRVANAYLFTGTETEDLKAGANSFIEKLEADKIEISPQGQNIKIDQIRELKSLVRYGPWKKQWLAVLIERADALNMEAANSFLKLLEEPPERVVFLLLAEKEFGLPRTIVSRCQRIVFDETESPVISHESRVGELKDLIGVFEWANSLAGQKEEIEQILNNLWMQYAISHTPSARIIMDTAKAIKKRANVRLALEVMGLKLWNAN